MKLPYCPQCGTKSRLTHSFHTGYVLACAKCDHAVAGHVKPEAAIKAFLWVHEGRGNFLRPDQLACGCMKSGCTHKMFEVKS